MRARAGIRLAHFVQTFVAEVRCPGGAAGWMHVGPCGQAAGHELPGLGCPATAYRHPSRVCRSALFLRDLHVRHAAQLAVAGGSRLFVVRVVKLQLPATVLHTALPPIFWQLPPRGHPSSCFVTCTLSSRDGTSRSACANKLSSLTTHTSINAAYNLPMDWSALPQPAFQCYCAAPVTAAVSCL